MKSRQYSDEFKEKIIKECQEGHNPALVTTTSTQKLLSLVFPLQPHSVWPDSDYLYCLEHSD